MRVCVPDGSPCLKLLAKMRLAIELLSSAEPSECLCLLGLDMVLNRSTFLFSFQGSPLFK